MSTFRDDGTAALEWAASYLERVRGLPVLSRVEPGAIRAALPDRAPESPEPFSAVLRDLDEVLMPGLTHWQSPRYFAYFATTGSEPGILAELVKSVNDRDASGRRLVLDEVRTLGRPETVRASEPGVVEFTIRVMMVNLEAR